MNDLTFTRTFPTIETPAQDRPSLLALSVWIRILFVGASLFVAGVVSIFDPTHTGTTMVMLAGAGVALTAVALMRTRSILRAID